MSVLKIQCKDGVSADELVGVLLAYARSHALGIEHHRGKDLLVLYRGEASHPEVLSPTELQSHPKVVVFRQRRSGTGG